MADSCFEDKNERIGQQLFTVITELYSSTKSSTCCWKNGRARAGKRVGLHRMYVVECNSPDPRR
jgi:hypothetical protein